MKNAWRLLGKVGFWLTWPALYVYLRVGKRTRVFIKCGDELLVVRGWLGSDAWIFPGGGLHRNEEPAAGAVREVLEETGIKLNPQDLTFLFEKQVVTQQGMRFDCVAYAIELPAKPPVTVQKYELIAADWRPISELLAQPDAAKLLAPALERWDELA